MWFRVSYKIDSILTRLSLPGFPCRAHFRSSILVCIRKMRGLCQAIFLSYFIGHYIFRLMNKSDILTSTSSALTDSCVFLVILLEAPQHKFVEDASFLWTWKMSSSSTHLPPPFFNLSFTTSSFSSSAWIKFRTFFMILHIRSALIQLA